MSWIQKLYETYQQCAPAALNTPDPLAPISHVTQQAHIEVTLDGNGNFKGAEVVEKVPTLVPATEDSANRTSGQAAHPLCDKLQYCAADYPDLGGRKPSYFEGYQSQLGQWCASEFSHPKAQAVLSYISQKRLVRDLIDSGVCWLDPQEQLCTNAPPDQTTEAKLFKMLTPKEGLRDQGDGFVRWRVNIPGDPYPETWNDPLLLDAWSRYDQSQLTKRGICMVTGEESVLAEKHPSKLRNSADKAKLVSSNDTSGFTFRGRFSQADQAVGVGFEVSQKAHNALRWLIKRQGFMNEDQVIVCWAVAGQEIPDPWADSATLFGEESQPEAVTSSEAGQTYAKQLAKALAGYRQNLNDSAAMVVMALDSATPGRLAITYYRELTGSEFLDRVQDWHEKTAWYRVSKGQRYIGAPLPREIAEAAYGQMVDSKLKKATVERLLPCIIDGRPLPLDLVESIVRRASNRIGQEPWFWERTLGTACALFRKQANGSYSMTLEEQRTSRDYLYGRLLAIADFLEGKALFLADEDRETTAARMMHRFSSQPFATWPLIHQALGPYKARLRAKRPKQLDYLERQIMEVTSQFNPADFLDNRRLSGEFLLGFYCQRQALRFKPDHSEETIEETQAN
ncbi:MAG: type I-C CRISPR-associated protein Cas8c/Csd1 [bacterium]|nr:type I-C CRISPR-associated protein Cas8c/Csd1 [bacterium]